MKRIIEGILKGMLKGIKRILIVGISIVCSLVISLISWNQIMCLKSNSQIEKIGKTITVEEKNMRVYEVGEGSKTIIMLSGLGTYSPILDYKYLADLLSKDYKVVVLEYFGYGQSDDTTEPRTSENIVEEIREAMSVLDIKPPYILMPHSISGIYSIKYAALYPKEVAAIVGIDMSMPNQTQYGDQRMISQGKRLLARSLDMLGITRLRFSKDKGYFRDMAAGGYYTEQEIRLAQEIGCRNTASKALVDENNRFVENTEPLYDVKYANDLPVLAILGEDSCKEFDGYIQTVGGKVTWKGIHEEACTNADIQKMVTLPAGHYVHWTQANEIAKQTKIFLENK